MVSYQQYRIGRDSIGPAHHSNDEVEQRSRVYAGKHDRKPADDYADEGRDSQEQENDYVGDGKEPLDYGKAAAQQRGVGIAEVQMNRLFIIG